MRPYIIIIIVFLIGCSSQNQNTNDVLPNGSYNISTFKENHFLKEVYNERDSLYFVVQSKANSPLNQFWIMTNIGGKYYTILSTQSNNYLTVLESPQSKTKLSLTTSDKKNDDSQVWIIQKFKNERFKIINKQFKYCLNIPFFQQDSGPLQIIKCSNKISEYWHFEMLIKQ